jgi:FkbM family methyltransferase
MQITLKDYEKLRPIARVKADDAGDLLYTTPNQMAMWRAETLFTKEPATIEWLRRLKPTDILLDVGANVGMYTIFAAAQRSAKVFAFEPESQNFSLLVKNIYINELSDKVVPICAALSDKVAIDSLYLSNFAWDGGSSCHSFGEAVGFDLKPRKSPLVQGCISYTIDQAIEDGAMEVPTFIKVDVDGFEHKVFEGAKKTLLNRKVRSICVEINPNLEEHQKLIKGLEQLGFFYDISQVNQVKRKEGAFLGCAEYIFDRPSENIIIVPSTLHQSAEHKSTDFSVDSRRILNHVTNKISQSKIITEPYPYVVIDDFFPASYYQELLQNFPTEDQMIPLGETGRVSVGAYMQRFTTIFENNYFELLNQEQKRFWLNLSSWLYSDEFVLTSIRKFLPWCSNQMARAQDARGSFKVRSDALIVNDKSQYQIGPHTDAPHRLISFLFYLPNDESLSHLGTSIYQHRDSDFECFGGPHYPFENFEKRQTIEFLPNRLLMFVRTNKSFHGVEEIKDTDINRRLLINNIRTI